MTDPTPTPPTLDLATLRVIAEGATEGPWRIYTVTDSGGRSAAVETAWAHDEQGEDTELVTDWCSPDDAAHIAAFDPPTVLALIARVTAAESSLARYIVERTRFGDAMAAAAVPAVVDAIMRELTADSDKRAREATARAEAAEAKIAAVRELAGEWESSAGPGSRNEDVLGKQVVSVEFAVKHIRAALDGTA